MLPPLSYSNIDINLFPTPEITESFKDKLHIKIFPENVPSFLSMKNKSCIWAFFCPILFYMIQKAATNQLRESKQNICINCLHHLFLDWFIYYFVLFFQSLLQWIKGMDSGTRVPY